MNFDNAVELILKHEGGYVNDPRDAGGETKYGISARAYPDLDIDKLSVSDAKVIYKEDYWDKIRGDDLPYPLALITFDAAVNSGRMRASKWLQHAVNAEPIDGIIGSKTVEAALLAYEENPVGTVGRPIHLRQQFIRSIRSYPIYRQGWERRIKETYEEAKKWIENS
jgi:lysozyme family protein